MNSEHRDVQPLGISEVLYAAAGVAFAIVYLLALYYKPALMAAPVWQGGAVPWGVVFALAAFWGLVMLAWLCIRKDRGGDKR